MKKGRKFKTSTLAVHLFDKLRLISKNVGNY